MESMDRIGIQFVKLPVGAQNTVDKLVFGAMRERRRLYWHVSGKMADTSGVGGELRDNKRIKPPEQMGPIVAEFRATPVEERQPGEDLFEPDTDGDLLTLELADISASGCALLAPKKLPFVAGMLLRFTIRAEGLLVQVRGRVVYARSVDQTSGKP